MNIIKSILSRPDNRGFAANVRGRPDAHARVEFLAMNIIKIIPSLVRIIEVSDDRGSDNRGSTVCPRYSAKTENQVNANLKVLPLL